MRIGICDIKEDSLNAVKETIEQNLDQNECECEILTFSQKEELINFLEIQSLDLLFLDMEPDGAACVEAARRILRIWPVLPLVFMEEKPECFSEVYRVAHCFYCLKGQVGEYMSFILELVKKQKAIQKEHLVVTNKGTNLVIRIPEIFYLERVKRITRLICQDETVETSVELGMLEKELGRDDFVRCHNSYVVNLNYMKEYRRNEIVLRGGMKIPVSRRYQEETREKVKKWIG
ncbi:MAG: LytTR family DNA-binding domain-containing protein [Eubacteriales bacterium]|nr:LytTR family DNA-binding domain-containing protein [Eubacteriales bacterium]